MLFLLYFFSSLMSGKAMYTVFLEQPDFGLLEANIGTQVSLRCSVVEGFRIVWDLQLPNLLARVVTDEPGVREALERRGIVVRMGENITISTLNVNATLENNGTILSCIAINESTPTSRHESDTTQLIFVTNTETTTTTATAVTAGTTLTTITTGHSSTASEGNSSGSINIVVVAISSVISFVLLVISVVLIFILVISCCNPHFGYNRVKNGDIKQLTEYKSKEIKIVEVLKKRDKNNPHEISLCKLNSAKCSNNDNSEYSMTTQTDRMVVIKKFKDAKSLRLRMNELLFLIDDFKHDNIAIPNGFCMSRKESFFVMEYMNQNNLNRFMNKVGMIPMASMLRICAQIADAMEHINSHDIIHCNLTAEGCLVNDGNEKNEYVVKVTDFNLSHTFRLNHYKINHTHDNILPIRWMAPELFLPKSRFTRWSDRWAFGVVMWEVFTYCRTLPYEQLTNENVKRHVSDGNLLPYPEGCRNEIFEIMKTCWNNDEKKRPTFRSLSSELTKEALRVKSETSQTTV